MHLRFDLATGERVMEGAPISLPHDGEFLISVRLEPIDDGGELDGKSLKLNGLLAKPSEGAGGSGEPTDEPMPLPWRTENGEDEGLDLEGLGSVTQPLR